MRHFGILIILTVLVSVKAKVDKKYENHNVLPHYITRKRAVNSNNPPKLTIQYNADTGTIAAIDASSSTSLIIDYKENLIQLANTQTGTSILVDFQTNTSYQLNNTSDPKLTSLKPTLESARQHKNLASKLTDLTPAISKELARDLSNLGGSFTTPDFFQSIRKLIEQLNKGRLGLLYKGKGSFGIHYNIDTFIRLNLALSDLLAAADDIIHSIRLNPSRVFSPKTGTGVLLVFLGELGEQADLTKLFGTLFKTPDRFLRLGAQVIAAVSHEGVDGLDIALVDIILLLEGKGSIREVINSLIAYVPSWDLFSEARRCLGYFEDIIKNQLIKYNNTEDLGEFNKLLVDLKNNSLVISNVNVSDIVNLLFFRSPREVFQSGFNIIKNLFDPRNIGSMIQSLFNTRIVRQVISEFFPHGVSLGNLNGWFSNLISRIPVFGPMISSGMDWWWDQARNIAGSLSNGWRTIVKDIGNGYFGKESMDILRRVVEGIRSFIEHFVRFWRERVNSPWSVLENVSVGSVSGEDNILSEFAKPLTAILGLRNKDLAAQINKPKLTTK